jgi:hypothetical protein
LVRIPNTHYYDPAHPFSADLNESYLFRIASAELASNRCNAKSLSRLHGRCGIMPWAFHPAADGSCNRRLAGKPIHE